MLVGDLIQKIRTAITDQPQPLFPPQTVTAVATPIACTMTPGTYWVRVSQRSPWGETSATGEPPPITVDASHGILITCPLVPWAPILRVYLTLANGGAGQEAQFVESSVSPFIISANPVNAGIPPTRNSAYNPDTDGDSFSCATLYDWVNDGLKIASQICGGLIDYGGVATVSGNPSYVVPGQWKTISDVWYDGYPLSMDKVGNYFRRNSITASVLASVAMSIFDNRMALEIWPQPARTAGATTLVNPMGTTDSSLLAASLAQFLLTNGMVQVDSEIMAYAGMSGGTLSNLLRGLGGTTAVSHQPGANVTELNLFFHGWRMYAPTFFPGQAILTIPIPVGWDAMLVNYGLARAKLAEQNMGDYQALYKTFKEEMGQWYRTNRIAVGPKQVGENSNTLEVIPGSTGISWVVP